MQENDENTDKYDFSDSDLSFYDLDRFLRPQEKLQYLACESRKKRFVCAIASKMEGRQIMEKRFRYKSINRTVYKNIETSYYQCTSHINCKRKYIIKGLKNGKSFKLLQVGAHTPEQCAESTTTGIWRDILPDVDNLVKSGCGPKQCIQELRLLYKSQPTKLHKLPTELQVKNRKAFLKRSTQAV